MGTSVLEIVNSTVYKKKHFLLDITRRVLHYDLDLRKESIETGIYPGALPVLQKASLDFL